MVSGCLRSCLDGTEQLCVGLQSKDSGEGVERHDCRRIHS